MTTLTSNTIMGGGGPENLYQLKWTHYQNYMARGLQSLLEEGDFLSDVTLASEGQFIQAHKMALALSSPFFKEFFKHNKVERPSSQCLIVLGHIKFKELRNILRFIYYGEVNVKQSELQAFLDAAQTLQIQGLENPASQPETDSIPATSISVQNQTKQPVTSSHIQSQQLAGSTGPSSIKRSRMSSLVSATSSASSPVSTTKISDSVGHSSFNILGNSEIQGPSSSSLTESHSSYDPLCENNISQTQGEEGEEMISLEEVKPEIIEVSGWTAAEESESALGDSSYSQGGSSVNTNTNSLDNHGAASGMFQAYGPPQPQPPINPTPGPSSQVRPRPHSQVSSRTTKQPGVWPYPLPSKSRKKISRCHICKLRRVRNPTLSRTTCSKCKQYVCAKETCRAKISGSPTCLACSDVDIAVSLKCIARSLVSIN